MIPAVVASRNIAAQRAGSLHGVSPAVLSGRPPPRYVGDASKPPPLALLFLGVLGCILVVVGTWYVVASFGHEREAHVLEFKAAVEQWPSVLDRFGDLTVVTRLSLASGKDIFSNLEADRSAEKFHDVGNGATDLPIYEALIFRTNHSLQTLVGESPDYTVVGPNVSVSLELRASNSKMTALFLGTHPLLQIKAQVAQTPQPQVRCKQLKGSLEGGRCWIVSQLRRICVRVEQKEDGAWKLAPHDSSHDDSYGCSFTHGFMKAVAFSTLPFAVDTGADPEMLPLEFVVRSYADPYLRAVELTHGTLDFGMTANDNWVFGLVMLGFGIAFCCPPCFAVFGASGHKEKDSDPSFSNRSYGRRYGGFADELE